MNWTTATPDPLQVATLEAALGVTRVQASLLVTRGFTDPVEAEAFLRPRLAALPQPEEIPGMAAAAQILVEALASGKRLAIWGDYDLDGISSTCLLLDYLEELGFAEVSAVLPHRERDGYGLSLERARQLVATGVELLVTVDCGISNVEEIRYLTDQGVQVIVTDHHALPGVLPEASVLVNPKLGGGAGGGIADLAGVGVAFFLAAAVNKRLKETGRAQVPELRRLLDLVALGTVADMVPLRGPNRVLVYHALACWGRFARPGLAALVDKVLGGRQVPTAEDISFYLAPPLNAPGRMEDPLRSLELLRCRAPGEADRLALELLALNDSRKDMEKRILDDAMGILKWPSEALGLPVLASPGWHRGVLGIVAAKLVRKVNRPVFVLSIDEDGRASGSARSVEGYDLMTGLRACEDLLARYGGHAMAAGVELATGNLEEFTRRLGAHFLEATGDQEPRQEIFVDLELDPSLLEPSLAREIAILGPFGAANPKPRLLCRAMKVRDRQVFGKNGRRHLKLLLASGRREFEAMGFDLGELGKGLGDLADVLFCPEEECFRGQTKTVWRLEDVRVSLPEVP
jgi:single-stranded-DNA-specific exonuclease